MKLKLIINIEKIFFIFNPNLHPQNQNHSNKSNQTQSLIITHIQTHSNYYCCFWFSCQTQQKQYCLLKNLNKTNYYFFFTALMLDEHAEQREREWKMNQF